MRRTQITLTEAQYARLRAEAGRTGHSLAELIRRALDERYASITDTERLRLLDTSFGGWAEHDESGPEPVERPPSGTLQRLHRTF